MNVHIPTPCSENWDTMIPVAGGRHCALCQHAVIDLTTMTDTEVLAYLQQQPGRVCGRIQAHRLAQPAQQRARPIKRALAYFALALALVFGVPVAAKAQQDYTYLPLEMREQKAVSIRGQLVNEGKLIQLDLLQNGTLVAQTQTDSTGAFSFLDIEPGTYKLRVAAPQYVEVSQLQVLADSTLLADIPYLIETTKVKASPVIISGIIQGGMKLQGNDETKYPKNRNWNALDNYQRTRYNNDELIRFP